MQTNIKALEKLKWYVILLIVSFVTSCGPEEKLKAIDDAATVESGNSIVIPFLENDLGLNDLAGSAAIRSPSAGFAEILDNGTPEDFSDDQLRYTANPDFTGQDQIIYELRSSEGRLVTAVIAIHVQAALSLSLQVDFPPEHANLNGAEEITVRGRVAGAEDKPFEQHQVRSLLVNGVHAEFSSAETGVWTAIVPVQEHSDMLSVELVTLSGQQQNTILPINNRAVLGDAAIAIDENNQRIFVLSGMEIYAIDIVTGSRTLVSGPDKGEGPLIQPTAMAFSAATNQLYVVVGSFFEILTVDLATGDRRVLREGSAIEGSFGAASQMYYDTASQSLLISNISNVLFSVNVETTEGSVFLLAQTSAFRGRIDLFTYIQPKEQYLFLQDSGLYSIDPVRNTLLVSGNGQGQGIEFITPVNVVYEPVSQKTLVFDVTRNALINVDLENGSRTLFLELNNPLNPKTLLQGNGKIYGLTEGFDLIEIDPVHGTEMTVSDFPRSNPKPKQLEEIAPYDDQSFVYFDAGRGDIFQFNYASASASPVYQGPEVAISLINSPSFMDIHPEGDYFFLFNSGENEILDIDLEQNRATELRGSRLLPSSGIHEDIVFDSQENHLLYLNRSPNFTLERYELESQNVTELSNFSRGAGQEVQQLSAMTLDTVGRRVLITDRILNDVVAVDLASGNFEFLAKNQGQNGVNLSNPVDIVVDNIQNRALIINRQTGIVGMDLSTGELRDVSSNRRVGAGPNFSSPEFIVVSSDSKLAWVFDLGLRGIFEVELESGDRRILSSDTVATGPELIDIRDMSWIEPNTLLLSSVRKNQVLAVDVSSGNRSVFLGAKQGELEYLVADAENARLYGLSQSISSAFDQAILEIDLNAAGLSELSSRSGAGPELRNLNSFVIDKLGERLLASDKSNNNIVEIDLRIGLRSVLSYGDAPIQLNGSPQKLVLDEPNNQAIVFVNSVYAENDTLQQLVTIDLNTGEQNVVVTLNEPNIVLAAMAYDKTANTVLLLDQNSKNVLSVNLSNADKKWVPFGRESRESSMVLDEVKQLLFIESLGFVYVVDLKTSEQALMLY